MGAALGVSALSPQEEADEAKWIGEDHIRYLERNTYCMYHEKLRWLRMTSDDMKILLCMYEIALLAKAWHKLCEPAVTLNQEAFLKAFARVDLRSQLMLDALFNAADANNDLEFKEAVHALSVITRGTTREKAAVSFEVCDLNNDGHVAYEEALTVFKEMAQILRQLGKDASTFGTPRFVADNLYRYQSVARMGNWTALLRRVGITPPRIDKNEEAIPAPSTRITNAIFKKKDEHNMLTLSKQQWVHRAKRDPNVAECFGLFDLISMATVRRWELSKAQREVEGTLQVRLMSHAPHRTHEFYAICADRFLVMYKSKGDKEPLEVIPLDGTAVDARDEEKGFRLVGAKREWRCVVGNKKEAHRWELALRANVTRFNSFAPPRKNVNAKYFINGASYFAEVADAMEAAKKRILIADWFLSPQLPLKRGSEAEIERYRLDALLCRKVAQGVTVCIQVWDETNLGYHSLRSADAEKHFKHLDERIHFLRHPKWGPLQWTHHQKCVIADGVAYVGGIDLTWGRYENSDFSLIDPTNLIFPGRDFVNQIITHVECGGDQPLEEVDRVKSPRMPWHDIHSRVDGCAAVDVLRNYIQRWNHGVKSANKDFPLLCPEPDPEGGNGTCDVQVLRSATRWSVGAPTTEDSIYKAMLYMIETSRHYIFIENQYFISSTSETELIPRNKIALAILDRVRKAMTNKERFHVFIILPLFPAGSLKDLATRFVLRWIYKTINLIETSILQVLRAEFPQIPTEDYITFYNLRNFGFLNERWMTQQVYVHSKLTIIDDKHVLIGSANINDRSLIGERDSELACHISDTEEVDSTMNGQPYKAAKFAINMRRELWKILLGRDAPTDPVSMDTIHLWRGTAKTNSKIYRKVFHRIEDNLDRLDQWQPVSWSSLKKVNKDKRRLNKVVGFLVEFVDILRDAPMAPRVYQKEWFVDIDTFL